MLFYYPPKCQWCSHRLLLIMAACLKLQPGKEKEEDKEMHFTHICLCASTIFFACLCLVCDCVCTVCGFWNEASVIDMQLPGAPQEVRECTAVSMALYQLRQIRNRHSHMHTDTHPYTHTHRDQISASKGLFQCSKNDRLAGARGSPVPGGFLWGVWGGQGTFSIVAATEKIRQHRPLRGK